jgi:hypothetical protein
MSPEIGSCTAEDETHLFPDTINFSAAFDAIAIFKLHFFNLETPALNH